MSFMSFQGRIGRGMWWVTGVVQLLLIAMAIGYVAAVDAAEDPRTGWQGPVFFLIVMIFAWIGLCANIKRYHDRGKSGFWVLISFVPMIGPLWMLIELGFLPGTDGDNAFGPPPGSGERQSSSQALPGAAALASSSKLAKLDDTYFKDLAAKKAVATSTGVKARPSVAQRSDRPVRAAFGKRG